MGKRFAILLATFDGARFLAEQLYSLAQQTEAHIDILMRDQGSTDSTLEVAREHAAQWRKGEFRILRAAPDDTQPTLGAFSRAGENFRNLIQLADTDDDYYAFCDQDDLWEPDKLQVARMWLDRQRDDVPAVHCSRTLIIDENGVPRGMSPLFLRPPGFANAIVQNIAGGNTMVFNRAALKVLKRSTTRPLVIHDWWTYIAVTGVGGVVYYSAEAKTRYRQHPDNLIGENVSLSARLNRLRMVFSGRFDEWNDLNRRCLADIEGALTPQAREVLKHFDRARDAGGVAGVRELIRSGIHRQTRFGQASLVLACLLKLM